VFGADLSEIEQLRNFQPGGIKAVKVEKPVHRRRNTAFTPFTTFVSPV